MWVQKTIIIDHNGTSPKASQSLFPHLSNPEAKNFNSSLRQGLLQHFACVQSHFMSILDLAYLCVMFATYCYMLHQEMLSCVWDVVAGMENMFEGSLLGSL